jgi:hypothetical protein
MESDTITEISEKHTAYILSRQGRESKQKTELDSYTRNTFIHF